MSVWFPFSMHARPSSLRLLCLPYAGRGASIYSRWGASLAGDVEVWPVQLPGRETRLREGLHSDTRTLVPLLHEGVAPYVDRPYAIFGHSMGAFLGFELARSLRRAGLPEPAVLFVSGARSPRIPRSGSRGNLTEALMADELRRLGGTPEELLRDPELMQLFLPILRSDFELCDTYHYEADEPLRCPIAAYRGLRDPELGAGDLEAWRHETRGAFVARVFPGDHFFLHAQERMLLDAIARELAAANAGMTEGGRRERAGGGA